MKRTKKILSLLLALVLLVGTVATLTVSAEGDTVYVRVPANYPTPYCYMWNSDSDNNNAWPGVQMTSEGDNVYSYTPSKSFSKVIFNNGSGGTGNQTEDLVYPGANQLYDLASGKWEVYDLSSAEPSITISKKDGSSFKTESLTVTVTVKNADSAYYTVDGGAQQSFTDSAEVTLGASTAVGSTVTLFVSATNANGTVTSTATYTKKDASSSGGNGSDGATSPALDGYYGTNPDGNVGKRANITIDGSFSDWSEDMLIAQGAAWDVANHYKGGHENCVLDTYALFAAWDDNNLYVAWQMVNTTDTWHREGDGSLSDGGRVLDVPLILALRVDPSSTPMSNKNSTGGSIWGQQMGLSFQTSVDHLFYMSGKPGLGDPAMFTAVDDNGNTNYTNGCQLFKSAGIEYKMAEGNICSSIWGLNYSEDPSDVTNPDADWVDYKIFKGSMGTHNTKYDSFYEIKIPFSVLDIDASDVERNGIGAMLVATRGESGLDCIPFDTTMLDNVTGDYYNDPSTSAEKHDDDIITVPLAKIGNLSSGSGTVTPPTPPTPTNPTNPSNPTNPTNPTNPSNPTKPSDPVDEPTTPSNPAGDAKYFLGDADLSGNVNIKDATLIQKCVAGLDSITGIAEKCANADLDNKLSVKDATEIQKFLAGLLDVDSPVGEYLK